VKPLTADEVDAARFLAETAGYCPRRPYDVVAVERPSLRRPASCGRTRCETCGPSIAMQTAAVATWATRKVEHSRFFTGTLRPDDWDMPWDALRQKMRDCRRAIRGEGYGWEIQWAAERGKKNGMLHVHGIQHGGDRNGWVPSRLLRRVWGARAELKHINEPALDGVKVARYTIEEARRVVGYIGKNASSAAGMEAHLQLNGGRVAHRSRAFLHGATKREALADLRRELSEGEPLTWVLEPAWTTRHESAR
jgi:hypothetical protein